MTTLTLRRAIALPKVGTHAPFLVLSFAAVAFLLLVTRNATFFHDEWMYIRDRSLDRKSVV